MFIFYSIKMGEDKTEKQLKPEVEWIQSALDELKNATLSNAEKEKKANEIRERINNEKNAIENRILELKDKTDEESIAEKEKAEVLLKTLTDTVEVQLSVLTQQSASEASQEAAALQAEVSTTTSTAEVKNDGKSEEKKWFLWKSWEWIGDQWHDIRDSEKWKEEWWKNLLRTAWFVATWVGAAALIYKWFKKLFWKDKKKDEGDDKESSDKKEKKDFRDRPIWKVVKWTWIWTLAYYVAHGMMTWDWNPFNHKDENEVWDSTPWGSVDQQRKDYESLSKEDREVYENFANAMNDYYWNVAWWAWQAEYVENRLGDSDFDTWAAGLVPAILAGRYEDMDHLLSEWAFYNEVIWSEWHILRDSLKKWSLEQLKKFLIKPIANAANKIGDSLWLWDLVSKLNVANSAEEFIEHLKWNQNAEAIIRTVFRKSMSTISYLQTRRDRLEEKYARDVLVRTEWEKFTNMSEENQLEMIEDKLWDDEWYEKNIKPNMNIFDKLSPFEAYKLLAEQQVLDWNLSSLTQKQVDRIDKDRQKMLNIEDDDDISNIQELKEKLNNWKLDEADRQKLIQICEEFEEHVDNVGSRSWLTAYLPVLNIVNPEDSTKDYLNTIWWYEDVVKVYKDKVNLIKEKAVNNKTFSESDFDDLENIINDYFKFQKSLETTTANVTETREKNGNIIYRYVDSWVVLWNSVKRTLELVKDWNVIKSIGMGLWAIVSFDAMTWTLVLKSHSPVRHAVNWTYKWTRAGLSRVTNHSLRNRLPWTLWKSMYKDADYLLKWDLANGRISPNKAAKIAKSLWMKNFTSAWWGIISSSEELFQTLYWLDPKNAKVASDILRRHPENENIAKMLFSTERTWTWSTRAKDAVTLSKQNMKYTFNVNAAKKLQELDDVCDQLKQAGAERDIEYKMTKAFVDNLRTVDKADDIYIMTSTKMLNYLKQSSLAPETYGKYLAKYIWKIDPSDLSKFEEFIIKAWESSKEIDIKRVTRNWLKNFDKLKKAWFADDSIDALKLNSSKRSKLADKTKAACKKTSEALSKIKNNPRFKSVSWNISKQIESLNERRKSITPEWMKSLNKYWIMNVEKWFTTLTEAWMSELRAISMQLSSTGGKELLNLLQKADKIDDIKDALTSSWMSVTNLSDDILLKIANTSNKTKIKDIVEYGASYWELSKLQKFLSSPGVKQAWRIAGTALAIADFAITWYTLYNNVGEANKIKEWNPERWERKEQEARVTAWFATAAWVMMLIPGIGWVGAWVAMALGAMERVANKYYEDIDTFKQNYEDFKQQTMPKIKQTLVQIDAWDKNIERTWIDQMWESWWTALMNPLGIWWYFLWRSSIKQKEKWVVPTKADWVKALVYLEELQNYPYAAFDLNDPKVLWDSELKEIVEQQKQQLNEITEKRFSYIKTKYIDKKKDVITKGAQESCQWIQSINNLLRESRIAVVAEADASYTSKDTESPDKYVEYVRDWLKQENSTLFDKLEKLYEQSNRTLYLYYSELPYFNQFIWLEGDKLNNAIFFQKYMQYKTLWLWLSDLPTMDFKPDTVWEDGVPKFNWNINYDQINYFLENFAFAWTVIEWAETPNRNLFMSNIEFQKAYWISSNLWQDILFTIAKECLGYDWENDLETMKYFYSEADASTNWIYFDAKIWKDWKIEKWVWRLNEEWRWDHDRAFTEEDSELRDLNNIENIKNLKKWILDSDWFLQWDMVGWWNSHQANKETIKMYSKIMDEFINNRENQEFFKEEIRKYIKNNAHDWKEIVLPLYLLEKWAKAGISGLAACSYSLDSKWNIKVISHIHWEAADL